MSKHYFAKKFKKIKISCYFLMVLLFFQAQTFADTAMENSYLARIQHVLISLKPLINHAEKASNKNDRLKFQYPWLRSDIEKIEEGIQQ